MYFENKNYEAKSFDDLTFANDFMFCKVLTKRPDLLVELTELITGRKVKEIRNLEGQKSVRITHDGKGVIYDVYFEDGGEGTAYEIEMQTVIKKNLPRRTRFYQSIIDSDNLDKGLDYDRLPDSYIIFICLDDPFTESFAKYSFEERCEEKPELRLNDGARKIFINASGTKGEISDDLRKFIDFLAGKSAEDDFTKKLKEMVEMVKKDSETRREYLLAKDRERQIKQQGYIIGAANMLKKLNYSQSEIVNQLVSTYHIDENEAEEYLKESDKVTV